MNDDSGPRTMITRSVGFLAGMLALGLLLAPVALGADAPAGRAITKPAKSQFLRLARDAKGRPESLDTAIVRFAGDAAGTAVSVDLIAAVHIADKRYYERLNREFRNYDVVLYELVAPRGTRIPKGGRKTAGNPVSAIQMGMRDLLELDYQLDRVDYTAKNFVHADMSPKEFAQSMRDRGESAWDIIAVCGLCAGPPR